MHPLLTPRLYAQSNPPPLTPLRAQPYRPLRDWVRRTTSHAYRQHGRALGFVAGLAIAWWLLAPDLMR